MEKILLHLKTIVPTKIVKEAMALYGTCETPGTKDNKIILSWARDLGIFWYDHDSIPWCGLFMATVVNRAGYKVVKNPLAALSWKEFGIGVPIPEFGDIVVLTRDGGGHVAIYIGESSDSYYLLGGNQSDMVNIKRLSKSRAVAFRRPPYKMIPKTVKRYYFTNEGELSVDEA